MHWGASFFFLSGEGGGAEFLFPLCVHHIPQHVLNVSINMCSIAPQFIPYSLP